MYKLQVQGAPPLSPTFAAVNCPLRSPSSCVRRCDRVRRSCDESFSVTTRRKPVGPVAAVLQRRRRAGCHRFSATERLLSAKSRFAQNSPLSAKISVSSFNLTYCEHSGRRTDRTEGQFPVSSCWALPTGNLVRKTWCSWRRATPTTRRRS